MVSQRPEEHDVFYSKEYFQCHLEYIKKKGSQNPKIEGHFLWFAPFRREEITYCPTAFQALGVKGE